MRNVRDGRSISARSWVVSAAVLTLVACSSDPKPPVATPTAIAPNGGPIWSPPEAPEPVPTPNEAPEPPQRRPFRDFLRRAG